MIRKISASLILFAALALPVSAQISRDNQVREIDNTRATGFAIDKNRSVTPTFSQYSLQAAGNVSQQTRATSYRYKTANGVVEVKLASPTWSATRGLDFGTATDVTAQYGQLIYVGPYEPYPYGYVCISGGPATWKTLKYVLDAWYGAEERMNPFCAIPLGWARFNGPSNDYGYFRYLTGARFRDTYTLDAQFGIPFDWVKVSSGWSNFPYARFMYAGNAPFGAEITADPFYPVPSNYLKVGQSWDLGVFRNYEGAPSGTQWYVDVSWGMPSDWVSVTNGWPYRWIRKP